MPGPIGFIGVGQMGQPMARNLLKAGFELRVYDKHPEQAAPLVALGAHQAFRLSDVTAPGGIVITMVPDDQALEEVVLSEGGILEQLGANGIHLSMSTVSPQSAERFAALYAEHGSYYLAATVLGRPDVAAAARLSIFLAGPRVAKYRRAQIRSRLCTRRLHVSYQACCELVFQLLSRVGPLEGLGGLVIASNEVLDRLLKLIKAAEMIGLQEFALQETEPDLQLIEPRSVDRQPIELHPQFPLRRRRQLLHPTGQLFGRMGRPIIQHQCHRLHLAALGFCNDNRLEKGTEVDKAFARMALAIDQPISDTEARPSGAVRHGECNVGTDRLDAWARLDEDPARLDGPESRFSHRHRPPRSPVAAKHQRVRTDRGQDGPAAGMSWVPGCVARSGTARGGFARR